MSHKRIAFVDGIRGMLVWMVALCHYMLQVPGGFVGVDGFFVLSGFCIGNSILKESRNNWIDFNAKSFMRRRFLRILPAPTVLFWIVMVLCFYFVSPSNYVATSKTVMWQSLSLNSIQEIRLGEGYDAKPTVGKPLHHTWSLSVEEFFYVGLAAFLFGVRAVKKIRSSMVTITLVTVMIASFAWSTYFAYIDQGLAYFSPFGRAWEIIAGLLVAIAYHNGRLPKDNRRWPREVLTTIGVLCLVVPCFTYSEATVFPGVAALAPVFGVVLILLVNLTPMNQEVSVTTWVAEKVFCTKAILHGGKVSYSFYLYHWVVIVIAMYAMLEVGVVARLALLGLSYALAVLSYRYVEKYFLTATWRDSRQISDRRVFLLGAASIALTFAAGAVIVHSNGWPERLPREISAQEKELWYIDDISLQETPEQIKETASKGDLPLVGSMSSDRPLFLMVGDSHNRGPSEAFATVARDNGVWGYSAGSAGVLPLLDCRYLTDFGVNNMDEYNQVIFDYVVESGIPNIILCGRWEWSYYTDEKESRFLVSDDYSSVDRKTSRKVFDISVQKTVQKYQNAGVTVWFLSQVPKQPYSIPDHMSLYRNSASGISIETHNSVQKPIDEIFVRAGARMIDLRQGLFGSDGVSVIVVDNEIVYVDDDHLSPKGLLLARQEIERVLVEMKNERNERTLSQR